MDEVTGAEDAIGLEEAVGLEVEGLEEAGLEETVAGFEETASDFEEVGFCEEEFILLLSFGAETVSSGKELSSTELSDDSKSSDEAFSSEDTEAGKLAEPTSEFDGEVLQPITLRQNAAIKDKAINTFFMSIPHLNSISLKEYHKTRDKTTVKYNIYEI